MFANWSDLVAALSEEFPQDMVSWRVGSTNRDKTSGLALAYIDSRDVQDRLDEVCGTENWQSEHFDCGGGKLGCRIGIRLNPESDWVWKSDGAGDTKVEAEKGAFSGAFKRSAVAWGVGRYLYEISNPWMPLDEYKKIVGDPWQKISPRPIDAARSFTAEYIDKLFSAEDKATFFNIKNDEKLKAKRERIRQKYPLLSGQITVAGQQAIQRLGINKKEEAA